MFSLHIKLPFETSAIQNEGYHGHIIGMELVENTWVLNVQAVDGDAGGAAEFIPLPSWPGYSVVSFEIT